jgi:2-haloacid dehalogenase
MMQKIKAIIFDLGNVLIDWNPAYVFEKLIEDEEKRKHFFENICTADWNEEQDAGRPIKQATEELIAAHPEWKEAIEAFYGRWIEMLGGPINETVEILRQLKQSGHYKLYALTNWSAETFPTALEMYDFLHWFDGRVVSGEEKMRKPNPLFYQILLDRFQLKAEETLFIDDSARNVNAAEQMRIKSILFHSPQQLEKDLKKTGILC